MSDQTRRAWVEQIMGLPVSVHVRGPQADAPETARLVQLALASLRADDRRFSTYRADSEVTRMRSGGVFAPSEHLATVLGLCSEARRRTDGAFDAMLPGGFDPSGLVKGWAVERAGGWLRELQGTDWLINAGGDVLLLGVTHTNSTAIHLAEKVAGRQLFVRYALTPEGVRAAQGGGCGNAFDQIQPHVEHLERRTTVGGTTLRGYALQPYVRIALELIERDPFALLCNDCERCRAHRWRVVHA